MLILTRRQNEGIVIGDNMVLTVVEVRGDKVRLGIIAPREASVHRHEVWLALYGAPWPPPVLDPAWLTWQNGTIVQLARAMAERGDYQALPVLADALEEAGCTDPIILDHCRSADQDIKRSWVVHLIVSAS